MSSVSCEEALWNVLSSSYWAAWGAVCFAPPSSCSHICIVDSSCRTQNHVLQTKGELHPKTTFLYLIHYFTVYRISKGIFITHLVLCWIPEEHDCCAAQFGDYINSRVMNKIYISLTHLEHQYISNDSSSFGIFVKCLLKTGKLKLKTVCRMPQSRCS
jgi:hypothetical protein